MSDQLHLPRLSAKRGQALFLFQFLSISLCNVSSKIMSKNIAAYLKMLLPKLISKKK